MAPRDTKAAEGGAEDRTGGGGVGSTTVLAAAAWHSLTWLLVGCCIGLLLGALLLFPQMNRWLGEWTYGRWAPLHLNLNLYGWCSLPLVAWLLRVYQADRPPVSRWSRATLWGWSAALATGASSWLAGRGSGKLFLDWQGFPLMLLGLALLFLWGALARSFWCHWGDEGHGSRIEGGLGPSARRAAQAGGLILLLVVPFALYWAAGPKVYPPVNPDTGGPTGASLLESALGIVLILLVLPYGLIRRRQTKRRVVGGTWWLFLGENVLCLALGPGNASHHQAGEYLGLGSLLVWVPVLPAYFRAFDWPDGARRWRGACLFWWGLLVASAWVMFLPGALDRFKFTDALVGHSHLAMAGFVSSLNLLLLVALLGESGRGLNTAWAFYAWQTGTLGYVILMFAAGFVEGKDPAFTIVPGFARDVVYSLRMVCGGLMLAAAHHWWREISRVAAKETTPRVETGAREISVRGLSPGKIL